MEMAYIVADMEVDMKADIEAVMVAIFQRFMFTAQIFPSKFRTVERCPVFT